MLSARDRALAVTDPPTLKTASVDMAASGDRAVVILSLCDGTVVRLRADRAELLGLFTQAGVALGLLHAGEEVAYDDGRY